MMTRHPFLALTLLLAPSCAGSEASAPQPEIEGFGSLRFGMSFEDVLAAKSLGTFNPAGVADCADTLILRGCLLTQRTGPQFDLIHESVPYKLAASIGRDNKLYEITLWFEPEAKLSRSECISVLEATVDWSWPKDARSTTKLKPSDDQEWRTTRRGVRFPILRNGDFATVFMPEGPAAVERSYFAHFLTIDGAPECRVSVSFAVPTKAPRLDPES